MRSRRLTVVAVAALLACPAAEVWGQVAPGSPAPPPSTPGPSTPQAAPAQPPTLPLTPTQPPKPPELVLKVGALLPLNGPGAWFGAEIKQGLELAATELEPPKRTPPASAGGGTASGLSRTGSFPVDRPSPPSADGGTAADASPTAPAAETGPATTGASPSNEGSSPPAAVASTAGASSGSPKETGTASASPEGKKPSTPALEPVEPTDQPRNVALGVQAADVQPLDVKNAEVEVTKLLVSGVVAIVTASPTPTLTIYPLAAGRDVLVLHTGLATERFPTTSRTLVQLRPSVTARGDVLAEHAWARGIRRLAVLSAGDAFGRAIRAVVAGRWRQQGGVLAHEESISLDASDLRSRLRAATRSGPEAVLLGFQGAALGEAARALRGAGYAGQILAVDDDRAALLAGGSALEGALILSDAFVPVPGTRGARFAKAYEARHGRQPSRFAANAYEAATLLATAATHVAREGRSITGARLRDFIIRGGPFPSLYAGELVVRDDGTVGRPLALFRVADGTLAFEDYVGLDGVALTVPKETTSKGATEPTGTPPKVTTP